MAVNNCHFGVQKAVAVSVYFNASFQQGVVHRSRGVVLHEVLVFALQKHGHLDASASRLNQRTPELAAG